MRQSVSTLARLATLGVALAACRGEQTSAPIAPPSGKVAAAEPASPGAAAPTSAGEPAGTPEHGPRMWAFDADKAGDPPAGFSFGRTGEGAQGRWIVKAEPDAPSGPNVLAQVDTDDTDYRFPVAVADTPSLRDVELSVRCKPVSGKVDQACGLVFRYQDANNYYITRANALEGNVRLYYVKDGSRKQIASYSGPVTANAWHELRVDAREDHLEIYWDGKRVMDHHDRTFMEPGRVGVWTKADSVTYFDDLSAKPL